MAAAVEAEVLVGDMVSAVEDGDLAAAERFAVLAVSTIGDLGRRVGWASVCAQLGGDSLRE